MLVRCEGCLLSALLITSLSACGGGSGGNREPPIFMPPPPTLGSGQVATTEGTIQGVIEGDLLVFRGVRYAAPPIGDLRFKAPAAPAAFSGVRDALAFGSVCTQPAGAGTVGEEDCLFLNVWAHDDDTVRPVMVYLHPGSASGVGGDMASIDPAELADSSDVVVVNLNRRIGALGYLAIDELIQENPRVTAGNYGLLDVIAALEWVQDNVAAFNGDPNRVMLFGTSRGGILSCHLLGAPEAAGLMQSIAIQSAPCGPAGLFVLNAQSPFTSRFPPAVVMHRDILATTGCDMAGDVLACLRGLTAEELIQAGAAQSAAAGRLLYVALIDGVVVQSGPRTALENQTIGDIPLIVGMAANETNGMFANLEIPDDASYRALLASLFPDPIDDELYALYPTANYVTPKEAYLALIGDLVFSCAAEELARSAMTGAPSYLYEITRGFDTGGNAGRGATHAIDIVYLFGNFETFGITPDVQTLLIRDSMRLAWSTLAGDPMAAPMLSNGAPVTWPVFDPAGATYVAFGDPIFSGPGHRNGRCATLRAVFL